MNHIDYDLLVQKSLYQVVQKALEATQKNGNVGSHYFLITFSTQHFGVDLPDYLLEEFPEEMTIILQHEFWDLNVSEYGFSVGLAFDEEEETIFVPYESLVEFKDPHSQFCLEFTPMDFQPEEKDDEQNDAGKGTSSAKASSKKTNTEDGDEENKIISLDQFRKNK